MQCDRLIFIVHFYVRTVHFATPTLLLLYNNSDRQTDTRLCHPILQLPYSTWNQLLRYIARINPKIKAHYIHQLGYWAAGMRVCVLLVFTTGCLCGSPGCSRIAHSCAPPEGPSAVGPSRTAPSRALDHPPTAAASTWMPPAADPAQYTAHLQIPCIPPRWETC